MLPEQQKEYVKLALPKGRLLSSTSHLLEKVGLGFDDYTRETRIYRLQSSEFPNVSAKIFQERDVPIQVAVGNYDFGICGLDWIEELLVKFPASSIVKVANFEYGNGNIYMASSRYGNIPSLDSLSAMHNRWRIVTEYPNFAEYSALNLRLKNFGVFPVLGAAEAYPPENADLVVLWAQSESDIESQNLIPLKKLLSASAFLIANKQSWQTKDISQVMARFSHALEMKDKPWLSNKHKTIKHTNNFHPTSNNEKAWFALPDGHQQKPAAEFLHRAGINIEGYSGNTLSRRPTLSLEWVNTKVIRPQDMPLQIANGNFDIAVTGKDWLLDHLYRFPTSPATELAELGFGKVKIVAVVSQEMPVASIKDLRQLIQDDKLPSLRVASEYVNIADKYLRDNRISKYKIIPTWGATEAFLPEDADLLIENTETGKTLAKHNLKIIDTLFQSTACLIGNKNSLKSPLYGVKIATLAKTFRQTATGK